MDARNLDPEILGALNFTPDPRITIKIKRSAKILPETKLGTPVADMQIYGAIYMRAGDVEGRSVTFSFYWHAKTDELTHRPDTIAKVRHELEKQQRWVLEHAKLEKTAEAKEAVNFAGLELHYDHDSEPYWYNGRQRTSYFVHWYVFPPRGGVPLDGGLVESEHSREDAQERAEREAVRARQALLEDMEQDDEHAEV